MAVMTFLMVPKHANAASYPE
jgi:hypothetical protein